MLRRPRVLHLGKFYPPVSGGMERVLQLLCEREKDSVDIRVLVANDGPETVREVVNGVPVTRAGTLLTAGSVPVCPSLPWLLRRERADIIVIHEPNPFGLLSYALARPAGRVLVWFHAEVVRDPRQYAIFYRPWLANAMRRAAGVIVTSPPMAEARQLREWNVPVRVIPLGIDEQRLIASSAVMRRAGTLRHLYGGPVVLFVGRFVPYKGLDTLLRAMARVPATLVLVGDGPERAGLESLAGELGIRQRIAFVGEVDDRELVAWYHACEVLALPSVTRAEAFGMVQTEAMACGKPVVSTDLPTGVPWVNRHRETGLVVPPGNAAELASALTALVKDPDLRQRMGAAGIRRVASELTADRMAARTVELYREIAAGAPCAPMPVAALAAHEVNGGS